MNRAKELKFGAMIAYFTIGFNIISGLLYTPWIIDQIGDSDYGLYTLANSLINLVLFDFGLSAATSRFVSKYLAEGRQDKVNHILGIIYKLYLLLDAVVFVVLFALTFFLEQIYSNLTPIEVERFRVVFIMSALFALINFPCVTFTGILNAYEKFISLKVADALYRVAVVLITVVALLFNGGLYALVAVHVGVGLATLAYKFYIIKTKTPLKVDLFYKEKGAFKDLFTFSIWITVSTLAQRLVVGVTPSLLGIVSNSMAIAVFGIVALLENYIHMVTTALNGMFMPKIARILNHEDSSKKLNELIVTVGRFQFAVNGLIVVGFLLLGKDFFLLWLDEMYMVGYYGLLLIAIPNLFYYSTQIANTAMVIKNYVKFQAITNLVVGILNVILTLILAKFHGVLGACVAICIAYTVRNIGYYMAYYKMIQMDIGKLIKECYVSLGIPMIGTIALGCVLNHLIAGDNWLMFAVKVIVVLILYGILMFALGLKQDERRSMLAIVHRVLRK